jgi:hypothetical protein
LVLSCKNLWKSDVFLAVLQVGIFGHSCGGAGAKHVMSARGGLGAECAQSMNRDFVKGPDFIMRDPSKITY